MRENNIGTSMQTIVITREMRKNAGSNKYRLSKDEVKEIKKKNKRLI